MDADQQGSPCEGRLVADFVVKVADEDGENRRSAGFERSAVPVRLLRSERRQ
jgi:hypothetical protein